MDTNLPDAVINRVPGWAFTARGRIVLSVLAVVVLHGLLLLLRTPLAAANPSSHN